MPQQQGEEDPFHSSIPSYSDFKIDFLRFLHLPLLVPSHFHHFTLSFHLPLSFGLLIPSFHCPPYFRFLYFIIYKTSLLFVWNRKLFSFSIWSESVWNKFSSFSVFYFYFSFKFISSFSVWLCFVCFLVYVLLLTVKVYKWYVYISDRLEGCFVCLH